MGGKLISGGYKNTYCKKDLYKKHTQIMPAPFMGDIPNASKLILNENPGYESKEDKISKENRLNY